MSIKYSQKIKIIKLRGLGFQHQEIVDMLDLDCGQSNLSYFFKSLKEKALKEDIYDYMELL